MKTKNKKETRKSISSKIMITQVRLFKLSDLSFGNKKKDVKNTTEVNDAMKLTLKTDILTDPSTNTI